MNSFAIRRHAAPFAGVLLLAAAAPGSLLAKEGPRIGAAGWSQVAVVGHSSDTAGNASHNGKSQLSWGAQLTLSNSVSDQLSIVAGVGIAAGHSLRSMPGEPTEYAPIGVGGYVSEASFTYNFATTGESGLFLRGGLFSYIYNPDVKNLGLYLLRGPVYPGFVVSGFETKHVLPVANMLGLQLNHRIGDFSQDFILSSETEFYPYFDLSPAYVASYRVHPALEVGAGVNFHHYIPVDGELTTDKSYKFYAGDTAGNVTDTIQLSFKGVKLMARASFDPKVFMGGNGMFGSEDLKLYGEIALLGLDNTEAHKAMYGDYGRRMPVMGGFNIPAFGYLDHLSIEAQWYGAPFQDDMEPYLTGYNKPTLMPVGWYGVPTKNNNAVQNVTRDNWKWSLHGAKVIQNHVRVSFQVANDHWRPGIYRGDGDTNLPKRQAIMVTPKDWYSSFKLAYFF
jgi:hypothetical protein